MQVESHPSRAGELGLPEGTGKQYDTKALESFYVTSLNLSPFEHNLFQDGLLAVDDCYFISLLDEFLPKKTKTERQKQAAQNDIVNLELFSILVEPLAGAIPARWGITEHIVEDINNANNSGVQLNRDLIRFAIIHPGMPVRNAAWEKQDLTDQQKVIAAFMGVNLSDSEENRKAQAYGEVAVAFAIRSTVLGEYGIDLDESDPATERAEEAVPAT